MILTGTPLQNNLSELWSLLNFLLPDAFADLEHFESMFDFSDVQDKDGHKQFITQERKTKTVASLHAILKPFLLRRVKTDVETHLPKKREYILYAPLSVQQKELYRKIKDNDIRSYLEEKAIERINRNKPKNQKPTPVTNLKRKAGSGTSTPNKSAKSSRSSTPATGTRSGRRAAKNKAYTEVSDREWFKKIEESSESEEIDEAEQEEQERLNDISLARKYIPNIPFQLQKLTLTKSPGKQVNQKKLQNPIMQLRLACNSPHHFSQPWAPDSPPDEQLVTASGKMLMLDRLVPHLIAHGHKILLFSQFAKQLDLLEDWARHLRHYPVCRIDGAVHADARAAQIAAFNANPDHRLFLLSTRAGGLGINLTAADTVILFDSDWNPQQDLQAQDRAHRIGQVRPVIVYRLATKGTVEQTLLEKADGKRRLEKLVIQKDKFRGLSTRKAGVDAHGADGDHNSMSALQQLLATDDFESYDPAGDGDASVLTDRDLEVLTDRSDEAFARVGRKDGEGGGDVGDGNEVEGGKFRTVIRKKGEGDLLGGLV